ncbi:uncharacterized protein LOC135806026 [Sycon ciliatum]|uniref:uncharacterized protein LOC135806026 n=1 Tax=Sycon ciliatum TaxID=27933 RepID=UPI0031F6EFBC
MANTNTGSTSRARVFRGVCLPSDPLDEWLTSCVNSAQTRHICEPIANEWDVVVLNSTIASISPYDATRSPNSLIEEAGKVCRSDDAHASKEYGGARPATGISSAGEPQPKIHAVSEHALSLSDSESSSTLAAAQDVEVVDGKGRWLVPGWIDMQVNDLEWMARWYTETFSREQHAHRIGQVLKHQLGQGVTGMCIATVASPLEPLLTYLSAMADVMDSQQRQEVSDRTQEKCSTHLYGAVVEGTFMNPACHGCHNPKYVLPPSMPVLRQLLGTGAVRTINIAPEMGLEEETLSMITHSVLNGALVSAGHCKPHARMLRSATEAGCSYIIHLGNGPTGVSLKAACDGGMMEESLRNDDLTATVICDMHHIHPAIVRDWTIRKTIQRVVAVSDAAFALGIPSPEFEVFGRRGKLSEDGKCLVQADLDTSATPSRSSDNIACLFGSNATMRDIYENLVNMFTTHMRGILYRDHPALSLRQAVSIASALCSSNPARLLTHQEGSQLSADVGKVKTGQLADLLLLSITGHQSEDSESDAAGLAASSNADSTAHNQPAIGFAVHVDHVFASS